MKKVISILAVVCLIALSLMLVACNKSTLEYDAELVINSNLENLSTNWVFFTDTDAAIKPQEVTLNAGTTQYEQESAKHGRRYIGIDSKSSSSYGYYSQEIALDKNATYILSCDIKVTSKVSSNGGLGAFVGLAESSAISVSIQEITKDWQTVQICFTNHSFDSVHVRFGLGTDLSTVTAGYAYFDNISLKKIQDPSVSAAGLVNFDLGKKGASGFNATYLTTPEGIAFTTVLVVCGDIIIYLAYIAYRRAKANDKLELVESSDKPIKKIVKSPAFLITCSAVIAFAVRLVLAITLYGHGSSLNDLSLAANGFANDGLITHYFESANYYTPGVSYILWLFGLMGKSFGLPAGSHGMAIFLKIPAIIADLVIVFILFVFAAKKVGNVKAFIISTVYGLVPGVFIASAVYSSYLSIGILFLMLALINAREKKVIKLTVYYTLSVLFSAESLWVLPLLLVYAVVVYIKNPDTRNKLPISATVSIVVSYLITLPLSFNFFAAGKPFIVLERYCTIFAANKYFTDGAFNIYAMCAQLGATVNVAGIAMSAILASLSMLYCIALYLKCRDRQKLVLLAGYTILLVFMFSVRMSAIIEIIALSILFLYAIMSGDRRILTTTSALATINTLSLCYDLMICKYIPGGANAQEITMSSVDPVAIIFSVISVLITLYMGYVVWQICIKKKEEKVTGISQNYFKYLASLFTFNKITNKQSEEE